MSILLRCKLVISKLSTWYYVLFGSKATEQEIQEWFAQREAEDKERERQQQESEHDLQEYLAKCRAEDEEVEREYLEHVFECKKRLEDLEFNRTEDERERRGRETEVEQAEEEHYRSHCPTCGSRLKFGGRCPGCDEAFGH